MKLFSSVFAAILAAAAIIGLVKSKRFRGGPNVVWRIVDLLVAGVFVYAGAIKVLDPVRFATDIDNYKILPWPVAVALGFYLPWLEIFCGLALILRRVYRGGLSILAMLTIVFLIATVAAKARGLDITCGCFGHASQHWSFTMHLALDLALLALVLILFGLSREPSRTSA